MSTCEEGKREELMSRFATLITPCAALLLLSGGVPYTAPAGDVNLDGQVDVLDVQCKTLLWAALVGSNTGSGFPCAIDQDCLDAVGGGHYCRPGATAATVCIPDCVHLTVSISTSGNNTCQDPQADNDTCLGLTPKHTADMNCDGSLDSADFIYLIAIVAGKAGLPGSADHDGDGKLNFCDDDSDNDAVDDSNDCSSLKASISDCDDGNPCTDDSCDGNGGCVHGPNNLECDDANPCSHTDTCADNVCAGVAYDCDDSDACTQDSCNGDGGCVHDAIDCDDGKPGTTDSCDPAQGCIHTVQGCAGDDDCPGAQFCQFPTGTCGNGVGGTCKNKPDLCGMWFDPVCGCNGQTYGNDCGLLVGGMSKAHHGECGINECSQPEDCPTGKTCEAYVGDGWSSHVCEDFGDNPCKKTGCSGVICADSTIFSTCEWLDHYACYQQAECGPFGDGDGCIWKKTSGYVDCMVAHGKVP